MFRHQVDRKILLFTLISAALIGMMFWQSPAVGPAQVEVADRETAAQAEQL